VQLFFLKTLEIRQEGLPSNEGQTLHSSDSKLVRAWHWVFFLSTNSVQTSLLKLALPTAHALEESLYLLPPCPLSHTGYGLGAPSLDISQLSDVFAVMNDLSFSPLPTPPPPRFIQGQNTSFF